MRNKRIASVEQLYCPISLCSLLPYKHKVGGSNPSATTRSIRRSSLILEAVACFRFQGSSAPNLRINREWRRIQAVGSS